MLFKGTQRIPAANSNLNCTTNRPYNQFLTQADQLSFDNNAINNNQILGQRCNFSRVHSNDQPNYDPAQYRVPRQQPKNNYDIDLCSDNIQQCIHGKFCFIIQLFKIVAVF